MLVGVLDLLLITMVFSKIVRQLKLVSSIFLLFSKWYHLNNNEKCFLLHLKSSFRYQDTEIFVFLTSPHLPPPSSLLRGWLKISLKVHEVINCLNKNLVTHFVWCSVRKRWRWNLINSINRVLNKEHLHEKTMQKMCTKS